MIHHRNWPTLIGYTIAVVTFLTMAGYGVAYATGYRLDFRTWQFQKTGVLAVTTRPAGATVTVSGKKYPKTTPLALRNVLPGEYDLEISEADYQTHKEKVVVKPGYATEISNIDLVLAQPDQTVVGTAGVADKVMRAASFGSEAVYITDTKKWFKTEDTKPVELNFDKVPTNVKTALANASEVSFIIKHTGSNTLIVGLTSAGKKWLAIADPSGFRGSLFGSPLNQALPENIQTIDNDRLAVLIGNTLYALDLNTSKLTVYAKNITSFSWLDGKAYIFSKDATGKPITRTDNNLFDDKVAETQAWLLPTAKQHKVLAARDNWWLIQTDNGLSQGLWLVEQSTAKEDEEATTQVMLSGDVDGAVIDYDKKQFTYVSGNRLVLYDIATHTEQTLRDFGKTAVTLLGRRNTSLFIQTDKAVAIVSPTGENYYELLNTKPLVLLSDDSRKLWMLNDSTMTEWIVRKTSGLFGMLVK